MTRSISMKSAAFAAVTAAALCGLPGTAQAALSTYTTEAAWLSAVTPPTLIDFDSLADGTAVGNLYPGLSFSAFNGGNPLAAAYGSSFSGSNVLSLGTPPLTGGGGGVAVDFSVAQGGVGFWYLDSQFSGNGVAVYGAGSLPLGTYEMAFPHPGEWLFVGFSSSANDITRIEVSIGDADAVSLDSLQYSAAAVPEPSTAALALLGGAFVLGALRRRAPNR